MDLGLLMAWSKCLMPLQMALFDFVFVFILAATAVAASVRSPFWAAWPGLNEKPYFSWCWPQFLTCDRLRLSGCCSSANLLLSALWAASLAAAWPDFVFRLGSKSHALAGSKKTQNRNQNRNPKCKGKTKNKSNPSPIPIPNTIQNAKKTVGDVCG